jgi:hypothetical protein
MGENPIPVVAAFFIGLITVLGPCLNATTITTIACILKY